MTYAGAANDARRAMPGAGGTMSMKESEDRDWALYQSYLSEIAEQPAVQPMKQTPQHKGGTSFAHCVNVAVKSYRLAKKLGWKVDLQSLARGAMLHDFYLYDTETMPYSDYRHSLIHPKLSLQNAEHVYALNDKEKNIILSHMWPIPGAPIPRSREAWLVCMADKLCASEEMYRKR